MSYEIIKVFYIWEAFPAITLTVVLTITLAFMIKITIYLFKGKRLRESDLEEVEDDIKHIRQELGIIRSIIREEIKK